MCETVFDSTHRYVFLSLSVNANVCVLICSCVCVQLVCVRLNLSRRIFFSFYSVRELIQNNHFQFDSRNWIQTIGTAVLTKIARTYATFTLEYLEKNLYEEKYGNNIKTDFISLWGPSYTIMNSSSTINTNPFLLSIRISPSSGLGHTSVGCVGRYTDLVGCVLVLLAVGRGCLT